MPQILAEMCDVVHMYMQEKAYKRGIQRGIILNRKHHTVFPSRDEIRKRMQQWIWATEGPRFRARRLRGYILIAIILGLLLAPTVANYLGYSKPETQVKQPVTPHDSEADRWEFYEDKAGLWRWRRRAATGEIVGASSRGYLSRDDATANARRHTYSD